MFCAQMKEYAHLVDDAIAYGIKVEPTDAQKRLDLVMDKLAVNFGAEITKIGMQLPANRDIRN